MAGSFTVGYRASTSSQGSFAVPARLSECLEHRYQVMQDLKAMKQVDFACHLIPSQPSGCLLQSRLEPAFHRFLGSFHPAVTTVQKSSLCR